MSVLRALCSRLSDAMLSPIGFPVHLVGAIQNLSMNHPLSRCPGAPVVSALQVLRHVYYEQFPVGLMSLPLTAHHTVLYDVLERTAEHGVRHWRVHASRTASKVMRARVRTRTASGSGVCEVTTVSPQQGGCPC